MSHSHSGWDQILFSSAPTSMGHSLIIYTVSIQIRLQGPWGRDLSKRCIAVHTYDTVQIINYCNYQSSKEPYFDIATGSCSHLNVTVSQAKTLNLKSEEAKPLFTNMLRYPPEFVGKSEFYQLVFQLKCFLGKNNQIARGSMLPQHENMKELGSSPCAIKYLKTSIPDRKKCNRGLLVLGAQQ